MASGGSAPGGPIVPIIAWTVVGGIVALGVMAVRGISRSSRSLSGMRTTRRPRGLRGHAEQSELQLFIENDGQLYRGQTTSIIKNLATKMAKGVYDRTKAEKLWMYLVESGAKKYAKESGGDWNVPGQTWHDMFSMEDRRHVAKELNDKFLDEWKEGSYRDMVPKKYQRA